jgi:hypothetical protein
MIKALVGVTIAALLGGYATAMQDKRSRPVQKRPANSTSLGGTHSASRHEPEHCLPKAKRRQGCEGRVRTDGTDQANGLPGGSIQMFVLKSQVFIAWT